MDFKYSSFFNGDTTNTRGNGFFLLEDIIRHDQENFLEGKFSYFQNNESVLENFLNLDDYFWFIFTIINQD